MREREFNLDMIRIIACLNIFNFHFLGSAGKTGNLLYQGANGGMGVINVTVFYLLSGYLLAMHDRSAKPLAFYRKRLSALYPMIWMMFPVFYLVHALRTGNFFYGGSIGKMIFSFLGIDAYLGWYGISSYYVIGEWFTSVILVVYLLYPLMMKVNLINRWMALTVTGGLYVLNNCIGLQKAVKPDASFFTGLFLVMAGGVLYDARKLLHRYAVMIIPICLLAVMFLARYEMPMVRGYHIFWANLEGLAVFLLLYCLFARLKCSGVWAGLLGRAGICTYAVYLCHHYIMGVMLSVMPLGSGRRLLMCYACSLLLTILVGIVFTWLYGTVMTIWTGRSRKVA